MKQRIQFAVLTLCSFGLLVVGAGAAVTNSTWLVRTWQTDEGLPENRVLGVVQTPDGFLLVATRGGMVRFDGVRFQTPLLGLPAVIPKREITALHFDRRGRLWLGYEHGNVFCLGSNTVHAYRTRDGLPDRRIGGFAENGAGTIFASYENGLGLLRIEDGKPASVINTEGLPANNRCHIVNGKQGEVWIAAGERVGQLRDGRFHELARLKEPVVKISAARAGGIWIATSRRLLKLREGQPPEEKAQLFPDVAAGTVSVLLEDRTGAVWIGTTQQGLLRWNGRQCERVETVDRQIFCLAEDAEGTIWVGTDDGLNQLRPRTIQLLSAGDGVSLESVQSVAEEVVDGEDPSARLWVVTDDGRVVRQEGESWVVLSSQADWLGGYATCVAADLRGAIWIGTTKRGLHQFENGKFRSWGGSDGLADGNVRLLFTTSSNDVWIAFSNPDALQRLRNGTLQTFPFPESTMPQRVRAMAEDQSGSIWVAASGGQLLRVEGERLVSGAGIGNALGPSIRCLLATPDGSLWIGCGGSGLARLKAGRLFQIRTAAGLGDDYISQMAVDGSGRLWCAGARGLFHMQLEELVAVAEGRAERVHPVVYGSSEGVKSMQASARGTPTSLRRRDGTLCFPMRRGLVVVAPELIQTSTLPPPVLLESVMVDGQPVALYDSRSPLRIMSQTNLLDLRSAGVSVDLRPNFHKLEFNFCAPYFTSPLNVNYRYRLEGFDGEWVEAGDQRSANYPALPAGDYRFRVTACNEQGVWNEAGATLKLTVTPFFWQRDWFRWGLLVLFTLSVVALARYFSHRRLRERMRQMEQQSALDRERARIARDMHDTLGASLTQINILGALAGHQTTPPEQVRAHVAKMTGSSQALVQQLDEIVWAVDPENDTLDGLATYISQFATEFFADSPIRSRTKAPALLPVIRLSTQVRHNLFLAVREALNNVARHSGATEVTINLTLEGDGLVISIEDNGRGFDLAAATKRHGLANLRQRLAEIGGTCRIESRAGAGTKMVLRWRCQKQ